MFTTQLGQEGLAVDLWPTDLQFGPILGIGADITFETDSKVVPATYGGIMSWAYVGPNPKRGDRTRTHILYYRITQPDPLRRTPVVYPAAIRIQGFVERRDTRCLGNWEGYVFKKI